MRHVNAWSEKWALVTGASAGIGRSLAEELAAGGANLVITARRARRLKQLGQTLHSAHGVRVETVAADLAQPHGPEQIFAFTQKRRIPVALLVNNAGLGSYGEFRNSHLRREREIVQVNCAAVVALTRLYIPGMIRRRAGDILIVASTAAYQGVPYMATYAASKGFDLLFAEALAEEVKAHGLRVCALCPGPTATEFLEVAGIPEQMALSMDVAGEVARAGLRALAAGERSAIPGFTNRLGVEVQRIASRRFVTSTAEKIFRPTR